MQRFIRTMGVGLGATGLLLLGACDNGTGLGAGGQSVSLSFRVADAGGAPPGPASVAGPPTVLEGTNGMLTIDEIRIIINEVELHRADGSCVGEDGDDSDGDCGEFEAGPRFLDLPLDGEPIEAVTALIPAGSYKELDFEIEDLEDDEDDAAEAALIDVVRSEILSEIPDWPREASAMVSGSFAPAAGGSIDFRVFLEAEIEIEFELIPNLVVEDDGSTNRGLTVDLAPDVWFSNPDGSVVPLHLYDYDETGELLEFEVEMEDGFTEIELDD